MQHQFRLLLKEQSDLGLHCFPICISTKTLDIIQVDIVIFRQDVYWIKKAEIGIVKFRVFGVLCRRIDWVSFIREIFQGNKTCNQQQFIMLTCPCNEDPLHPTFIQ